MSLRKLKVTERELAELAFLRDHSPKAYIRERAAGLIKIAKGMPAAKVAREGLLREREPDTIYGWMNSFEAEGAPGLEVKPGRGRKPSFPPSK